MRISILQGSATGTAVYSETHTATTNMNGLVSIEIGGGTIITGTFSSINWGNGPYFVKTETDPNGGTNYTIVGTSQFLSVPYALYAKYSGGSSGPLATVSTDAITFEPNYYGTTLNGTALTDGGELIISKGFCLSTNTMPTVSDIVKVTGQSGLGAFSYSLGLNLTEYGFAANTTYYVRAYVTTIRGTVYGEQISFTTNP